MNNYFHKRAEKEIKSSVVSGLQKHLLTPKSISLGILTLDGDSES